MRHRYALVDGRYRSSINHDNDFTSSSCVKRAVAGLHVLFTYPHPDDDHKRRTTDTPGFKSFTMALLDLLVAYICISLFTKIGSTHSIHSFMSVQSNS